MAGSACEDGPRETPDLADRFRALERGFASLKARITVTAIAATVIGGGGVFGIVEWACDRHASMTKAAAADFDSSVKPLTLTIESLQRDISRREREGMGRDHPAMKFLFLQLVQTEGKLRMVCKQFTRAVDKPDPDGSEIAAPKRGAVKVSRGPVKGWEEEPGGGGIGESAERNAQKSVDESLLWRQDAAKTDRYKVRSFL